ncbi:hypothetical protein [uncultured Tenacibaculum sp.]|uniref:hypothetical protein n=1 Tax=uncultured Tenacibaculum sp. TaxID=174713 RepID=UPI002618BD4A|nr:hypothetical protein [uncultured Tenacibaculum sp.]
MKRRNFVWTILVMICFISCSKEEINLGNFNPIKEDYIEGIFNGKKIRGPLYVSGTSRDLLTQNDLAKMQYQFGYMFYEFNTSQVFITFHFKKHIEELEPYPSTFIKFADRLEIFKVKNYQYSQLIDDSYLSHPGISVQYSPRNEDGSLPHYDSMKFQNDSRLDSFHFSIDNLEVDYESQTIVIYYSFDCLVKNTFLNKELKIENAHGRYTLKLQ